MKVIFDRNLLNLRDEHISKIFNYLLNDPSTGEGLLTPAGWMEMLDVHLVSKGVFEKLAVSGKYNIQEIVKILREGEKIFRVPTGVAKEFEYLSLYEFANFANERSSEKLAYLGESESARIVLRRIMYKAIQANSMHKPSEWAELYWAFKLISLKQFWKLLESPNKKNQYIMESFETCIKQKIPAVRIFSRIDGGQNIQFNEDKEFLEEDAIWCILFGHFYEGVYENVIFVTTELLMSERVSSLMKFVEKYVPEQLIPVEIRDRVEGVLITYSEANESFERVAYKLPRIP